MDSFVFFGLMLLVFIGLPIGIGLLLYFVPKKLGYPRTGKYLAGIFGLLVLTLVFFTIFEAQLFTKNDAKELVEEQGLLLEDKFDLKNNESISGIGEYYHTFTLEISRRDKTDAINKITSSSDFKKYGEQTKDLLYNSLGQYFDPKQIQNYETQDSYVREYFEPIGKQGYAPTFRRISVKKR